MRGGESKMKKHITLVVLALMLAATGLAYAELVEGEVASVDLEGKAIEVNKAGAAAGAAAEKVRISVNDKTTYAGDVTALAEVIEGDKVKVDADKDATSGSWVAKSVEVATAE